MVLFNNPSQAINTSVTLLSSVALYAYIDIEYKDNDGICGSVRVSAPDGKSVCLMTAVVSSDSGFWLKSRIIKLSGTSITTDKSSSGYTKVGQRNVSGTGAHAHTDCIAVTRVVGYS